jgi:hypothetical protein
VILLYEVDTMSDRLSVKVSFEDESYADVTAVLREAGGEDIKRARGLGVTGAEVILVLLAISALTNVVIKLTRLWKCGVVVDARGDTVVTRKDCNLPAGSVLVISKDGQESKLHEPSEVELKKLLEGLKGK